LKKLNKQASAFLQALQTVEQMIDDRAHERMDRGCPGSSAFHWAGDKLDFTALPALSSLSAR